MVGEDQVQQKMQNKKENKNKNKKQNKNKNKKTRHGFLAATILLFIGKMIITTLPHCVVGSSFLGVTSDALNNCSF